MSSHRLWVLGAPDSEMSQIRQILRETGERFAFAQSGSHRVYQSNAYQADSITGDTLCAGDTVILVECAFASPLPAFSTVVIDHHQPGSPGYGLPARQFLPASSIGQVLAMLARIGETREACPLSQLDWPHYQGDVPRLGRGDFYYHTETYGWQHAPPDEPARWWLGTWPWRSPCSAGITRTSIPVEIVIAAAADHCPDIRLATVMPDL